MSSGRRGASQREILRAEKPRSLSQQNELRASDRNPGGEEWIELTGLTGAGKSPEKKEYAYLSGRRSTSASRRTPSATARCSSRPSFSLAKARAGCPSPAPAPARRAHAPQPDLRALLRPRRVGLLSRTPTPARTSGERRARDGRLPYTMYGIVSPPLTPHCV